MVGLLQKIAQLVIASSIFFIFALYVWQVQLAYDSSIQGFQKATFFAVVIFAGGFSYDISKHLALLASDHFWSFFKHFKNGVLHFLLLVGLFIVSSYLLNKEGFEPKYWGFWIYLGALAQIYWIVDHFTKAIETASKGGESKEN